jgi:hypothetical protein
MQASILLIADFANVDAAGKLNVLGAFNQIFFNSLPGKHQLMYLVIRLVAELGETEQERQLKVVLWDEDGIEKWSTPDIPFKVKATKSGKLSEHNAIIGLQGMEFDKLGTFSFKVYVNGDSKGDIPIDIVLRDEADMSE